MEEVKKRIPAAKVRIADLVGGKFIKKEGFEPSVVKTAFGEFSRLRLMATVVDKFVSDDLSYGALTLDDSTETMRAKVFKTEVKKLGGVEIGDMVDIIGKVREYEDEIYVMPESIVKIDDPNWELLRKAEILMERSPKKEKKQEIQIPDREPVILRKIRELDKGEGVKLESLIKELGFDENEAMSAVRTLMLKGDLFEPKRGLLRMVE